MSMFLLVLACLGLLVTSGLLVFGSAGARLAGLGIGLLSLLFLVLSSTTMVDAKNAGVITTFGKPSERTLGSGLHFKAPWQKVTEVDGTVQPDEYRDDRCIAVRIGDGSKSCLTATIRWRIVPDRVNEIFADYRSDDPTETLRDAVVSTQFKSAAQAVLSEYNPVAGLEVVEGSNAAAAADLNFAPDYDVIAADLTEQMTTRLGEDALVEVQSITVSYLSLSETTQAKLDDFIAAVGDTRIAAQAKSTALEQAEANDILADSVSNNPGVLQSRCLDSFAVAIEKGYPLPGGFSCFGAGGSVVLPTSK